MNASAEKLIQILGELETGKKSKQEGCCQDKALSVMQEQFWRKLEIRMEAYQNLGPEEGQEAYRLLANEQVETIRREIAANMESADLSKYLVYHKPLPVEGGAAGRCRRFIKRAVRKVHFRLLGWIIAPLIDQQNTFNGKLLNAVDQLKKLVLQMEEER